MTSALVTALAIAGFALLVFGERIGLGPQLAAAGVIGVFAAITISLALASTTSRLARFMAGTERGASLGLIALVSVVLLLAAGIGLAPGRTTAGVMALVIGFCAAYGLMPFNPWRNFAGATASGGQDRDPGEETRGALGITMLAGVLAAGLIAFDAFPPILDRLAEMTGTPRSRAAGVVVPLLALVLVLGGLHGLVRCAKVLLVLVMITAVAPFIVFLAGGVLEQVNVEFLSRLGQSGVSAAADAMKELTLAVEWPALVLGAALGIVAKQPATAVRSAAGRAFSIGAGVLLAILLGAMVKTGQALFDDGIANRLVASAPVQWPIFTFDETLRGWLSVCGITPSDAQAAARACTPVGSARSVLPAGSLRFEPGLAAPALAASQGWPIILGFIWGLLLPLFGVLAIGFLVFSAASGAAERVLFRSLHPKALRSWRLAITRLLVLVGLGALYLFDRQGIRLDLLLFRWALLGSTMTALAAMLAFRLILIIRFFRARRQMTAAAPSAPTLEVH